ncbi:MAG: hemerythrin domain-containing protein [Desulfovibrionales bacterium]
MAHQLLETIQKDHQEVKTILKKLVKTSNSSHREELVNQLRDEIIPHMAGEEQHIYPSLLGNEKTKEDSLESLEEHHAAQTVLRELADMSPDHERFRAKASVLREMIEHHIKEEEDDIFEDLEDTKSSAELDSLLQGFNQTKERKKSRVTAPACWCQKILQNVRDLEEMRPYQGGVYGRKRWRAFAFECCPIPQGNILPCGKKRPDRACPEKQCRTGSDQ